MTRLEGKNREIAIKYFESLSGERQQACIDLIEAQQDRSMCCEPYDCMHHEQCGEEGWYCGSCQEGQEIRMRVGDVHPIVWDFVREIVEENEQAVFTQERAMIRDLEAVGDHAAVDRILAS